MNMITKKQFTKDLKENDNVEDVFVVSSKMYIRKYNNKPGLWFAIKVSDRTGCFIVKYWGGEDEEKTSELYYALKEQEVIFVKGQVKEFSGLAINVDNPGDLRKIDVGDYDPSDFVARTTKDIEKMKSQLLAIISEIQNGDVKRLLESFFKDETFLKAFSLSPAASKRHHNFIGGLIEHVLNLIGISKRIGEIHPELDIDILIAGCILHDIGKMKEYEVKTSIGYGREGKFLGHISLGQQMVADKIATLNGFPDILRDKILHLILSHHGKLEWGSPVTPRFPEAVALHYVDQCDAKIKGVLQGTENIPESEEWVYVQDYGDIYLD